MRELIKTWRKNGFTLRLWDTGKQDWELRELESEYPSSIIEFTRFGWPWGIYGRELGVWEVRNY